MTDAIVDIQLTVIAVPFYLPHSYLGLENCCGKTVLSINRLLLPPTTNNGIPSDNGNVTRHCQISPKSNIVPSGETLLQVI